MATIKDVARESGVSVSTVSRVFSRNARITPETQERVMSAASRLGYMPNRLAHALKTGRSNTIALIVPSFKNDIWPEIVSGIEEEARRKDYVLILCNTNESVLLEKECVERLKNNGVDGMIIAPAMDNPDIIRRIHELGIPVVAVLRGQSGEADLVHIDNFRAAYTAVEYLLERGHRKIMILAGNTPTAIAQERLEGFHAALSAHGFPLEEHLCFCSEAPFSSLHYQLTEALRAHPDIDAVFAASDPLAVDVINILKRKGYRIPEDISVIGIDDIPLASKLDPPLTTMAQPFCDMGRYAAVRLIERIESDQEEAFMEKKCYASLTIRKSTR